MTNYSNIAGTSFASFQIALGGPVIYQGTADPTVTPPPGTPNQGDIYLRHGANNQIWSYDGAAWVDTAAVFSGGSIAGDLDVSGQVSTGDPILVLNDGETGPGATGGPSGLEVDRGPVDPNAQWIWDEANDWWTPSGFADDIHSGRILLDTGATPVLTFVGDTATGIFSNAAGTISLTNGTNTWTMDSVGNLIPNGPGPGNVGGPGPLDHSATIYANRFFGDPSAVGTLPIFTFNGDDDTGMRNPSGGNITFRNDNTDTVEITSTGILRILTNPIEGTDGTISRPAFSFTNYPNYGMYVDSGLLKIGTGFERIVFAGARTEFGSFPIQTGAGVQATPGVTVGAASDGLISASNTLGLVSNAVERMRVESSGLLTADPTDGAADGVAYALAVAGDGTNTSIPNKRWVLDSIGTAAAAGASTEIQFNTGGVLDASSNFTWNDGATTLGLNDLLNSAISAVGQLTITGGSSGGSGTIINAGAGGSIQISAGAGGVGAFGGPLLLTGGSSGTSGAGSVTIAGGTGAVSPGTAESLVLDFTPVSGATLIPGAAIGNYFDIDSTSTAYRVWFDDGTNTAPAAGGRTLVPVPFTPGDINQTVSNNVVAALIGTTDVDFAGAANGGTPIISVTMASVGNVTDPSTTADVTWAPPPIVFSSIQGTSAGVTVGASATLQGGAGVSTGASGPAQLVGGTGGNTGGSSSVIGGDGATGGGDVILTPGSDTGDHSADGVIRLSPKGGQTAPELRFLEDAGGASNYVGLKAPGTVVTPRTWVLPQDNPAIATAGNTLVTDGTSSGNLGIPDTANAVQYPVAPTYLKGALPPVGAGGGYIYVSDAIGASLTGSLCYSNGAVWIDVTTGAAVL